VFKNQAACAFRAYATHRLGATGLEGSHDGLDAAERGVLAHATLACLMQKIASRDSLESLSREDKHQIIDESVKSALNRLLERDPDVISEEFAKLEVMRLTQLCENLLEQELQREPFAVKAVEEKRVMRFAGIEWDGQIDRIDLWRSGNLIIDYKTGKISKNALQGERPDEPQLPLYALTTEANNGVMYIGLQNGDINYQGFLSSKVEQFRSNNTKSKNIEHIEHWEHQLIDWKRVLTRLAEDFKAGDASVDPKKFPQTCEYCELKAVCRVREIYGMADGDEEEEGLIDDSNQALGEV
jgi:RecB family exonuclease